MGTCRDYKGIAGGGNLERLLGYCGGGGPVVTTRVLRSIVFISLVTYRSAVITLTCEILHISLDLAISETL